MEVVVSYEIPSGRQWGHPLHPLVEYATHSRKFDSRKEAQIFVDGLKINSSVRNIQIDGWRINDRY